MYVRDDMTLELIESRVDLAVVERLGAFADRLEKKWFRIQLRVDAEDVQHDTGGCAIISATNDIPVADDEDQLTLVVILEGCEGVDRSSERVFTFCVTRDLTQNEFVLQFRLTLASEL